MEDEMGTTSCPFCGLTDFTTEFGPRMCFICAACDDDYHVSCLEELYGIPIEESILDSEEDWYCSIECSEVVSRLATVTNAGKQPLEKDFLYTYEIVKYEDKNKEVQAAIAAASKILKSAFKPLELDDGTDMLGNILRSASLDGEDGYDYSKFRVVLVRKAGIAVTAATLRVFGQNFAELPFIATRSDYQREGNCRRLVCLVEKVLRDLKVKELIVPSVKKLANMWKKRFGMRLMKKDRVRDLEDRIIIPDSSSSLMLVKPLTADESESSDEGEDHQECKKGGVDRSDDRLMTLATILAEEDGMKKDPGTASLPHAVPEDEEGSDMEEDFLEPPDIRPLWGNEIAAMLKEWTTSDDSWKHWDLDNVSFQKLLRGSGEQPLATSQKTPLAEGVDSLCLSAYDAALNAAQHKLESEAQKQIHMLALQSESRILALQQEIESLKETNAHLETRLTKATEEKESLLQQTAANTAAAQKHALEQLAAMSLTEEANWADTSSIEEHFPTLQLDDVMKEPSLGAAQICRCLESLQARVDEVTDLFAQLRDKYPNEEFLACLRKFLLSTRQGLSLTHDLALKVHEVLKRHHFAGLTMPPAEMIVKPTTDCTKPLEETSVHPKPDGGMVLNEHLGRKEE